MRAGDGFGKTRETVATPNRVVRGAAVGVTANAADALSGLATNSCGTVSSAIVGARTVTRTVTRTATDNAGMSTSRAVNCTSRAPVGSAANVDAASALTYVLTDTYGLPGSLPLTRCVAAPEPGRGQWISAARDQSLIGAAG
ncbi:MAG: hypothetical protein ACKV2O_21470 [Acidimicrobiales bacterium]